MMRILFLFLFSTSSVHVWVADAEGARLPNVQVELVLYEYHFDSGQTEVDITFSDQCKTDQNGECTILIGETTGLLHGRLDLGKYGGRDVIWPGGVLDAPIQVDLKNNTVKGTEAKAFDFQEKDGGVRIQSGTPWLVILTATLLVCGIIAWAYLRSRSEHA